MKSFAENEAKTILVVDDEEQLIIFFEKLLISEGYKVITARDGREAVNVYKSNHTIIDMILMDIIMPKTNGTESCKELLKIDTNLKILLMSGFPKDSLDGFEHIHFIRKPIRPTELFRYIDEIFDTPKR